MEPLGGSLRPLFDIDQPKLMRDTREVVAQYRALEKEEGRHGAEGPPDPSGGDRRPNFEVHDSRKQTPLWEKLTHSKHLFTKKPLS
eukprot:scaffold398_cov356-Pavlova_lutheri.AAC.6